MAVPGKLVNEWTIMVECIVYSWPIYPNIWGHDPTKLYSSYRHLYFVVCTPVKRLNSMIDKIPRNIAAATRVVWSNGASSLCLSCTLDIGANRIIINRSHNPRSEERA